MTAYYDHVLAAIPLVLLTIPGLLALNGFALTTAVPIGALPAIGLIGHAMFVRSPTAMATAPSEPTTAQPTTEGAA